MNKKSTATIETIISLLIVVFVVLVLIAYGPKITKLLKSAIGLGTSESSSQKGNTQDSSQKILDATGKYKCTINSYCKAQNLPCQCFSSGDKSTQETPDTCTAEKPYCYDGVYGCSSQPPENPTDFDYCRYSNSKFNAWEFSDCINNNLGSNRCQATNMPCKCKDKSGIYSICIPQGNKYCHNNEAGCISTPC